MTMHKKFDLRLSNPHDPITKKYRAQQILEAAKEIAEEMDFYHHIMAKTLLEKRRDEEDLEADDRYIIAKQQALLITRAFKYIAENDKLALILKKPSLQDKVKVLKFKAPGLLSLIIAWNNTKHEVDFLGEESAKWAKRYIQLQDSIAATTVALLGATPIKMPDGSSFTFDSKSEEAKELQNRLPVPTPTVLMDAFEEKDSSGEMPAPPVLVEYRRLRNEEKLSQSQARDRLNLTEQAINKMRIKAIPVLKRSFVSKNSDWLEEMKKKGPTRLTDTFKNAVEAIYTPDALTELLNGADNQYIAIQERLTLKKRELAAKNQQMNEHVLEFLLSNPGMQTLLEEVYESHGLAVPNAHRFPSAMPSPFKTRAIRV
jgi:hypothetical protein